MTPVGQDAVRPGVAERLEATYAELTPRERVVADVMLERLPDLALYSASELARFSGVSKATVSRLYRRLGYAGAEEVRDQARALRASGTPVAPDRAPATSERIARELTNVARCLERAGPVLPPLASALAAADRVLVLGFRSGRPLAEMLRQQLVQARPAVHLLPTAGHSLGEDLADLGGQDVVVLVGPRRRPAVFARLVSVLADSPARVALMGDASSRRYVAQVDHWLECPLDTGGAFDSHAPAAALIAVLADAVLTATGAAGARRVTAVDRTYRQLGELEEG